MPKRDRPRYAPGDELSDDSPPTAAEGAQVVNLFAGGGDAGPLLQDVLSGHAPLSDGFSGSGAAAGATGDPTFEPGGDGVEAKLDRIIELLETLPEQTAEALRNAAQG